MGEARRRAAWEAAQEAQREAYRIRPLTGVTHLTLAGVAYPVKDGTFVWSLGRDLVRDRTEATAAGDGDGTTGRDLPHAEDRLP
jgi:hypothetical protein